jgi:tetratricopeptide (TPR) repeat protein
MRGIGTLSWENKEGVATAMRILSAPSAQEAKALIDQRGITHLASLSWDSYFDDYARMGTGQVEGTFRHQLRSWALPLWLRPMVYQLPVIDGFEGQSATLYEVVDEQNEATALARTAEYFIEMGDLDRASSTAQTLRRFPGDLGAWVARAEVEMARGDEEGFAKSLKLLQARLATKTAPILAWDLRVRLAVVLAKAKQVTLAQEQMTICLATGDESKIRMLSTGSLYRLLVMSRGLGLKIDAELRGLALELLPSDLRERVR